jgi:phytoene dehydrogenase-like protein
MRAIVIGSGMAGLTAAAYLARAGYQVTVFEQQDEIGGVTATLRQHGFGWDLGPLLLEGFAPYEPAGRLLAELGLTNQVQMTREDRGVAFPDFALWKPADYAGPQWRRERLQELFPDQREALDHYYRFYDRLMDLMSLARRAENAAGLAALLLKLRLALAFQPIKGMADWNAAQVMDHFFERPELRALYTGILADFVVRPSQYPGLGVPAVNVETAFDKRIPAQVSRAGPRPVYHYILGGCGKLVEAAAGAVRASGGEIFTGATVTRIRTQDGRATGVELDGGRFEPADLVLASGGVRETFFELVGPELLEHSYRDKVEHVPFMESVLMVHVGTDLDPAPYQPAALCYYYNTYDVEGAVQSCQQGNYHEGKDGFLIYVPSRHSPDLAPAGHHAITVYTIAPNQLIHGTWAERREELADKLLAEAERVLPGLRERSAVRVVLTPDDFRQRTRQRHHSFGGAAPVMGREGAPHRTPIGGLWFIGSQSESRGGVAGVMAGARKVVRMIQEEANA